MSKILFIFLLTMTISTHCLYAEEGSANENQSEGMGRLTDLLWKNKELTENDKSFLLELAGSSDDAIASKALVVGTVRNASDIGKILDAAARIPKGKRAEVARQIREAMEQGEIAPELTRRLLSRPYVRYSAPQADDFLRNIIVCLIVRKARENNKLPEQLPALPYDFLEQSMLRYGYFPEEKAFSSIFAIMYENLDNIACQNACMVALSAYSRIFFREAIDKVTVKDTPKTIRETLLFYLRINRNRMDSDQKEELDKIIKQLYPENTK